MNSFAESPRVGIVTLNWNNIDMTNELLESLDRIEYRNVRIYVVDNGSDNHEGSRLKDEWEGRITLIQNATNLGFAKGANLGIRQAISEMCTIVLLINNDTIVEPSFLGKLVSEIEAGRDIGVVAPLILSYDSPQTVLSAGGRITFFRARATLLGQGDNVNNYDRMLPFDAEYVSGACMLVRADLFNEIGVLPEGYFAYFEETEFCVRARRMEHRIRVVPSALIWHHSDNPSWTSLLTRERLMMRNRVLFLLRNGGLGQAFAFFVVFAPFEIGGCIVSVTARRVSLRGTLKSLLGGFFAGVAASINEAPSQRFESASVKDLRSTV